MRFTSVSRTEGLVLWKPAARKVWRRKGRRRARWRVWVWEDIVSCVLLFWSVGGKVERDWCGFFVGTGVLQGAKMGCFAIV